MRLSHASSVNQQIRVSKHSIYFRTTLIQLHLLTAVSNFLYRDTAVASPHHRSSHPRDWILSGPRPVHGAVQPPLRVPLRLSSGHQRLGRCIPQYPASSVRGILSMHIRHDGALPHRPLAAFDVRASRMGSRLGAGEPGCLVGLRADGEEFLAGERGGWS